jgi:hypothetical protein
MMPKDIAENLKIPLEEVLRIKGKVKKSEHKLQPAPSPGI